MDENTGSIIFKKNIPSLMRPIVSKNNLFLITKKNLLNLYKSKYWKIYLFLQY